MRHKPFVFFLMLIFIGACENPSAILSDNAKLNIKETLEKLAVDNLKAWEPPFSEEAFLDFFTQTEDFSFAVDGFHITSYEDWVGVVYESMDHDRKSYKTYTDNIEHVETDIINEDYGFVTVDYTWDYTNNDDVRYMVKSIVTMLFRKENGGWKIVNTHCSHG
ncbi:MAG: nuclear transport factor 2 family protein, partial [Lewinella sp.]|nr:nuclear transport factor 2 family protein [Lewinella sp.]